MGTDPWAQESVMGVTGSEWDSVHVLLKVLDIVQTLINAHVYYFYWDSPSYKLTSNLITGIHGSSVLHVLIKTISVIYQHLHFSCRLKYT